MATSSTPSALAVAPATATAPSLALRPWLARDIPTLVAAHTDPQMRRWLLHHLDDEGQARTWLEQQERAWAEGTRHSLAVVELNDLAGSAAGADELDPVGSVSIRRLSKRLEAAEVGYWVASQARGRSIAPRAVEAAIGWATEYWAADPVKRFELIHSVGNDASCRVALKLGFELEEELPAHPLKFPDPGHLHVRPA